MKKVEIFNSIGEFMNVVNTRPTSKHYAGYHLESQEGSKSFTGTENYEEANELFSTGWMEGKKYLTEMTAEKKAFAPTPAYQRKRTQAGGRLHIGALVANAEAVWVRRQRTLKDNISPIVSVYFDMTVPGIMDKSDLAKISGRLFSAIRNLEEEGYKIELYLGFTAQERADQLASLIRLKNSNEPISEVKMLYPVVHPSFLRRHNFRWLETTPIAPRRFAGYGHFVDSKELKTLVNTSGKKIHAAISAYYAVVRDFKANDFVESIKAQRAEAVK